MMMALMMCLAVNSFEQETFKITYNGLNIVQINSHVNSNINYIKTIQWVHEYYKNPNEVIMGNIKNESVTINGYQPWVIQWGSLGVQGGLAMEYHIYIEFKDSIINLKMQIDKLSNHAPGGPNWYISTFFKKDGSIRPVYTEYLNQLELAVNELLGSYKLKIKEIFIMSSEEALSELKRYKDKLDLELITQEEFDKKKEELSKYIK